MKKILSNDTVIEISEYLNKEYNLRLVETRQFCLKTDAMLDAHLETYNAETGEIITTDNSPEWLVDQLCDDVWFFDWEKQEDSEGGLNA